MLLAIQVAVLTTILFDQVSANYIGNHVTASDPTGGDTASRRLHPATQSTTSSGQPPPPTNAPADSSQRPGSKCADYNPPTDGGGGGGAQMKTNATMIQCNSGSHCFTYWMADPHNSSHVTISKQGCWLAYDGMGCSSNTCVAMLSNKNHTHFCCCTEDMCNTKLVVSANSTREAANTTTAAAAHLSTSPGKESAPQPLPDPSYKIKTIMVALVSLVAVSLVVAFTFLAYRLCITPKSTSPPSSSVTRVEADQEPAMVHFNLEDLKIEEIIQQGRYTEVRKGWLGDKEVAVKIYQQNHRQYYYNERTAFLQPFMDHENVVKFYGAKEQEDTTLHTSQYLIVTELISLGSLTSYLKHNTIDWYTLCHMCQGIARGLAHIHTDVQKGGLFKPAMAHRDVNTRNILVKPDLTCVIADFGFTVGMMGSKIIKNGVAENAEQASLADVGTLRYMAPEVFDGAVNLRDCEASLKQIDMYALGLVLWEVASRCLDLYQGAPVPDYQLPFQAEAGIHPTFEEMQVLVVKYKTRPKFPEVWKDSNPAVRSLRETIEDCWDTDAEARLTSLCVQERVTDMAVLWVHGTKHRGVTPTLNATMNLPETYPSNSPNLAPSFVNRKNETNTSGEPVDTDVQTPVISNSMHRRGELSDSYPDGITAPLITNVGQLTMSNSMDMADGRIRSWLHDQSVSESTVDTILPTTPSHDEIAQKADRPAPPPLKANNVMLAMNKAVISHPNQGRNPTVERNTHKRSDEELTVSGNRLLGPGDQKTDTSSPSSERRCSFGTQSAPPNHSHSFDGMDTVESSSLVQNDALSHQHSQPRNNPIPYLQNQVHIDGAVLVSTAPSLTRPKLANINSNRNSYLRLQGDDTSPSHKKSEDSLRSKSLKHRLSKFIRPIDLGHKFSKMMFGGKNKKRLDAGSGEVEVVMSKSSGPAKAGHSITSQQDACPQGRICNPSPVSLNMEVQMVNGEVVTRACSDANYHLLHSNPMSEAQARLSTTNAMRLGVLADHDDLPSPSLFPKSLTSSVSSDIKDQETALPLQNLVPNRDYGSMHSAVLNTTFVLDMPLEMPTNAGGGLADNSRAVFTDKTPLPLSHQETFRAMPPCLSKCTATSFQGEEKCCTVKSPQNKTITPINYQLPSGKNLRKKPVPEEPQGAAFNYSGLFQNDIHIPDTKGGNAVMFDIQVSDKSLSRVPHSVLPEKPFKKPSQTGISSNREPKNIQPSIRLSQSQSVTDLGWHQRCKSDDSQCTDKVWHERSGNNGFHRHRPKSLSLKGHNYNDFRPELRKSDNACLSAIMAPVVLKGTAATLNEQVKHNENGTVPMVVPNITLDKSSLPFLSTNIDKQIVQSQNLAVSSIRSSVSYSVSDGTTKQTAPEKISHNPVNCLTAEEKKSLYAADRSDSSEKIRRRIKTPVSFKKGRLSLYDDRLMSQSLGPESLTDVMVDQVADANVKRSVLVNHSDESGFRDYHKMIQSDSDLVL